jgi:hypothetical protein
VTTLTNQVHDGPASLPNLQILNRKRRKLCTAQSAANKHGNHRKITETAQIVIIRFLQEKLSLVLRQPISGAAA